MTPTPTPTLDPVRSPTRSLDPSSAGQSRVYGHDPRAVRAIRGGKAHRCKVRECAAVNTTEAPHCPTCHRSFSADYLADLHMIHGERQVVLQHIDPPGAVEKVNGYGWPVWTGAPMSAEAKARAFGRVPTTTPQETP